RNSPISYISHYPYPILFHTSRIVISHSDTYAHTHTHSHTHIPIDCSLFLLALSPISLRLSLPARFKKKVEKASPKFFKGKKSCSLTSSAWREAHYIHYAHTRLLI